MERKAIGLGLIAQAVGATRFDEGPAVLIPEGLAVEKRNMVGLEELLREVTQWHW